MRLFLFFLAFAFGFALPRASAGGDDPAGASYDIVVYGGTSAGVTAAIQAAKMGKRAVIIEPGRHLGGLTSGGLGWTDFGSKEVVGGLSRAFYRRVKAHYDRPAAWRQEKAEDCRGYRAGDDAMWVFEPHVAERILREWVEEHQVLVRYGERLDLASGVTKEGTRIVSIRTESGLLLEAKVFVDATYEGDLLAKAGVSYTVGREGNDKYSETLNGVQTANAVKHQFLADVSPYVSPGDRQSGLLPGVHAGSPGEEGQGDHRIQAYCFRMCLTDDAENRVPFEKPEGYDPLQYEILARYLATGWDDVFAKFDPIPNRKTDTNNHGAFSTDNIGRNYDYPDGDYATRERITRQHELYQKGLMYFLANDTKVPRAIRERMSRYGLARDEFVDNGHWPHQLYVREARRMVSDHVHAEADCRRLRETPEPVGMGSYNMDSHNVQRYVDAEGFVRNEGDIQVSPGGPYRISYRSLRPRKAECTNLLVPVCVSASHIAYGSIRMEPVFMVLGQSAATAACLAIDAEAAVQDVDYAALRERLLSDGQVLDLEPPRQRR
jgi:hypothetical protein